MLRTASQYDLGGSGGLSGWGVFPRKFQVLRLELGADLILEEPSTRDHVAGDSRMRQGKVRCLIAFFYSGELDAPGWF